MNDKYYKGYNFKDYHLLDDVVIKITLSERRKDHIENC